MRKAMAALLSLLMLLSLAACGDKGGDSEGGVKEFTAFFAVPGPEINSDNEIQAMIAEITGAKCKENWLTGQTAAEAIGTLIAGGEYPDFVDGSDATQQLYDAGALIPIDEYWDDYPNIKNFWNEQQWDLIRRDDGHVYWIPQFGRVNGVDTTTIPDEAFWIQVRVLEWAGYPEIQTLDEYFDLLERYQAANPTMDDGTPNIPYTILCDDWRYFCLENPPEFLDGYPNDGSVIVDTNSMKIVDYNTTPTAKRYFAKLNEEFQKGMIDPESFTQTYDEYIAKLSTGRVLGMVDQYWNFGYTVTDALKQAGLNLKGCDYVPLGITIDKGVENHWFTGGSLMNGANGLGITTSCDDIPGAMQFINDLLEPEVHTLRWWGVKDVDYMVDENGLFYRTPEQRTNAASTAYKASHLCTYNYFPGYKGMDPDGINAARPEYQPGEFYDALSDQIKACFDAYGVQTHAQMLGIKEVPGPWFPMYSYSNNMTTATPGGVAWTRMGEIKHEYLPKVVLSSNFESAWNEYLQAYATAKPEDFLSEMQTELDARMELAAKYE